MQGRLSIPPARQTQRSMPSPYRVASVPPRTDEVGQDPASTYRTGCRSKEKAYIRGSERRAPRASRPCVQGSSRRSCLAHPTESAPTCKAGTPSQYRRLRFYGWSRADRENESGALPAPSTRGLYRESSSLRFFVDVGPGLSPTHGDAPCAKQSYVIYEHMFIYHI